MRQARAPHLFCDWLKRSGKEPTQTRQEGRRLALNARDAACSPAPLGWGRGQGPGSWAAHLAESPWDVGHGRSQARESSVRSLSSQALGLGQGGDLLALRGSAGARCGVKQGILGLRRICQAPSLAPAPCWAEDALQSLAWLCSLLPPQLGKTLCGLN